MRLILFMSSYEDMLDDWCPLVDIPPRPSLPIIDIDEQEKELSSLMTKAALALMVSILENKPQIFRIVLSTRGPLV